MAHYDETQSHCHVSVTRGNHEAAGRLMARDAKSVGLPIAGWAYRFEPTDQGCSVTETWTDKRGWLVKTVSPWVSGVQDRATHNEATMTESL